MDAESSADLLGTAWPLSNSSSSMKRSLPAINIIHWKSQKDTEVEHSNLVSAGGAAATGAGFWASGSGEAAAGRAFSLPSFEAGILVQPVHGIASFVVTKLDNKTKLEMAQA